jgi:hypothetical protein
MKLTLNNLHLSLNMTHLLFYLLPYYISYKNVNFMSLCIKMYIVKFEVFHGDNNSGMWRRVDLV